LGHIQQILPAIILHKVPLLHKLIYVLLYESRY
jgi:hypothetical protein